MADVAQRNVSCWSRLLLAAILVGLVGGVSADALISGSGQVTSLGSQLRNRLTDADRRCRGRRRRVQDVDHALGLDTTNVYFESTTCLDNCEKSVLSEVRRVWREVTPLLLRQLDRCWKLL